jgi:AbrB family looped-hinge helix DNA binding protein
MKMTRSTVRITGTNRVLLPKAVRDRLRVAPGDVLVFHCGRDGVRVEKASAVATGSFGVFSEWYSAEDEEAYRNL